MSKLPSAFKSPKGETEYMAAYEASMKLWPVPYEQMDITGGYTVNSGLIFLIFSGIKIPI